VLIQKVNNFFLLDIICRPLILCERERDTDGVLSLHTLDSKSPSEINQPIRSLRHLQIQ